MAKWAEAEETAATGDHSTGRPALCVFGIRGPHGDSAGVGGCIGSATRGAAYFLVVVGTLTAMGGAVSLYLAAAKDGVERFNFFSVSSPAFRFIAKPVCPRRGRLFSRCSDQGPRWQGPPQPTTASRY